MSTPVIWIFIPVAASLGLLAFRRHRSLVNSLGILLTFGLGLLAKFFPFEGGLTIGSIQVQISTSLAVLGRTFTLPEGSQTFLALIFLTTGFWFLIASRVDVNRSLIPAGLGVVGFLVAATAVQPFLYAALLIEVAVLWSVLFLSPPGVQISRGVLRYLIFLTLAMPFILFTGWMLSGTETVSANSEEVIRAVLLFGLSFAFLLAIFPFHTWIPLLAEDAGPLTGGFIFWLLQTTGLFLMVTFLDQFGWLRTFPVFLQALRLTGLLMVVSGGLWAAFQTRMDRMFGYAVIIETGMSLLALSLNTAVGFNSFAELFLSRAPAYLLWVYGATQIKQLRGSLDFQAVEGVFHQTPFAAGAVILSALSLAGVPLLAAFPIRLVLLEGLSQQSISAAVWTVVGCLGLLAGALRMLWHLLKSNELGTWTIVETRLDQALLSLGAVLLLAFGVFPQTFVPPMLEMLTNFTHLGG
ncbi:MAG: proton-conducting transporter membrane subunit [Anaerolineaceae bacterium]